ncbi:MAG: hypothetical protein K0R24_602 [Gammaproteobacteria bacterium]|jgi:hypothetical protein|nr:hypothetical protein [Gammaproteobacteria bacterium]
MLGILKLQRKIADLEIKISSNRLSFFDYNKELKEQLLTPGTTALIFSLCFLTGFYFEYKNKGSKLISYLRKRALTFSSYFIKAPFYISYLGYRYLKNQQ